MPTPAIAVGQYIAGTGVTAGTAITAFRSGISGGVGTYTISGPPQWVAPSTALTTTVPGVPLAANNTTITGFVKRQPGPPQNTGTRRWCR